MCVCVGGVHALFYLKRLMFVLICSFSSRYGFTTVYPKRLIFFFIYLDLIMALPLCLPPVSATFFFFFFFVLSFACFLHKK